MSIEINLTHENINYKFTGVPDSYYNARSQRVWFLRLSHPELNHKQCCGILFEKIPLFRERYSSPNFWPTVSSQSEVNEQIEYMFELLGSDTLRLRLEKLNVSEQNIQRILECQSK